MEKVRHQTDLKIITNNGTSDTRCLLRKCVVKDTLFLWDSCQNLQPESHERPSEEPGWGTFYKIAGRYASEMSRAWETCRDTQINAKGYLDWLLGQKKKCYQGQLDILKTRMLAFICLPQHSPCSDPQLHVYTPQESCFSRFTSQPCALHTCSSNQDISLLKVLQD